MPKAFVMKKAFVFNNNHFEHFSMTKEIVFEGERISEILSNLPQLSQMSNINTWYTFQEFLGPFDGTCHQTVMLLPWTRKLYNFTKHTWIFSKFNSLLHTLSRTDLGLHANMMLVCQNNLVAPPTTFQESSPHAAFHIHVQNSLHGD